MNVGNDYSPEDKVQLLSIFLLSAILNNGGEIRLNKDITASIVNGTNDFVLDGDEDENGDFVLRAVKEDSLGYTEREKENAIKLLIELGLSAEEARTAVNIAASIA